MRFALFKYRMSNKRRSTFTSARHWDEGQVSVQSAEVSETTQETCAVELWCVGIKFSSQKFVENSAALFRLERDLKNAVDDLAIGVYCDGNSSNDSELEVEWFRLGYIQFQQAHILASHIDSGSIKIISASQMSGPTSGSQTAVGVQLLSVILSGDPRLIQKIEKDLNHRKICAGIPEDSKLLTRKNSKFAEANWKDSPDYSSEPDAWDPRQIGTRSIEGSCIPAWEAFDLECCRLVDKTERKDVWMANSWPPNDTLLLALGCAPSQDRKWWYKMGLKPPAEWAIHGCTRSTTVEEGVVGSSEHRVEQKQRSQLLDNASTRTAAAKAAGTANAKAEKDYANEQEMNGAVHGISSCWSDEFVAEIVELLESPKMWCEHSSRNHPPICSTAPRVACADVDILASTSTDKTLLNTGDSSGADAHAKAGAGAAAGGGGGEDDYGGEADNGILGVDNIEADGDAVEYKRHKKQKEQKGTAAESMAQVQSSVSKLTKPLRECTGEKRDQLIRVFGGPYVLGQQKVRSTTIVCITPCFAIWRCKCSLRVNYLLAVYFVLEIHVVILLSAVLKLNQYLFSVADSPQGHLKLVIPAPHNAVTTRLCAAKNIIYAVTHLSQVATHSRLNILVGLIELCTH